MTRRLLQIGLTAVAASLIAGAAAAQTGPLQFYGINPCRVVDTRGPNGTNSGPILGPGTQRDFAIKGNCGVPSTAKAVSLNVTIANPTSVSFLTLWPTGTARPVVSTINFTQNDPSLANGAIVAIAATSPDLSVFNSSGNVNVIIDVTGYFQ
jgi:hypothetical protein